MQEKTKNNILDKDIEGAVFFILLGSLFLFITTGQVGWNIWLHIFKFWPLLLISAGLSIILTGLNVRKLFVSIISSIILIIILILGYKSYTSETSMWFKPTFKDFSINKEEADIVDKELSVEFDDYKDTKSRILDINVAASEMNVFDSTEDPFIKVKGSYNQNVIKPELNTTYKDNILSVIFRMIYQKSSYSFDRYDPKFDFFIGKSEIPTTLYLKLGAGSGEIQLEKLVLELLDVKVGAGSLTIDLSELSSPKELKLDIGAGDVNLVLPQNVGFEMEYTLGLGEIKESSKEVVSFIGKGNSYKSSNYNNAKKIIKIDTRVGVGDLDIKYK